MQAIKEAGIDVEGFLTVGVSAALRQLLEFGLFHGDPHPGNIFAMRDGRIAYVDFGNVAVLSQVCLMLFSSVRIPCIYSLLHCCWVLFSVCLYIHCLHCIR
jgi:hypothetical protein